MFFFCFSANSFSSLEDYISGGKRQCINDDYNETSYANIAYMVKDGRIDDLNRLIESMPEYNQKLFFDKLFKVLQQNEVQYSMALKQLMEIIRGSGELDGKCIEYIVQKILHSDNDNIGGFRMELKQIVANGYKFNMTTINKLMNHCIVHFDVSFHQFVLTSIVNKLTADELDQLNESILMKFTEKRLANVKRQRMGLSRKTKLNKQCWLNE